MTDRINHAGSMELNFGGGKKQMDCGCHGRCSCGCYQHGHEHSSHGGHTHIVKSVTNIMHGDGDVVNNCAQCGATGGDCGCDDPVVQPDNFAVSGTPTDNGYLFTMENGETFLVAYRDLPAANDPGCCNTGLSLNGTMLSLTQSNGNPVNVDLSSLMSGGDPAIDVAAMFYKQNALPQDAYDMSAITPEAIIAASQFQIAFTIPANATGPVPRVQLDLHAGWRQVVRPTVSTQTGRVNVRGLWCLNSGPDTPFDWGGGQNLHFSDLTNFDEQNLNAMTVVQGPFAPGSSHTLDVKIELNSNVSPAGAVMRSFVHSAAVTFPYNQTV